jgi:hypothetical protein
MCEGYPQEKQDEQGPFNPPSAQPPPLLFHPNPLFQAR